MAIIGFMCGRFTQINTESYAAMFGIQDGLSATPRYNLAPTDHILACRLNPDGKKEFTEMYWGLVPSWSNGPDSRYSMINARAETVAEKPAYRTPFRRHRCLVPADGFYEWMAENGKQPYYIHHVDKTPLVFAGIWDHWQDDSGDQIDSCAIIVCEANRQMRQVHERMPVILLPELWDTWLGESEVTRLQSMLRPYAKQDLDIYPVSKAVNNPKNDGEQLIAPV